MKHLSKNIEALRDISPSQNPNRFFIHRNTGIRVRDEYSTPIPVIKICLMLLLPFAGAPVHVACYLVLALWALVGPRRAIEALTLNVLITFLNPFLYPLSQYSELLRWIVVLSAFVSVLVGFVKSGQKVPPLMVWITGYFLTMVMFSIFYSCSAGLSLFKLVSFFICTSTVVLGYQATRDQAKYWEKWFSIFFITVLVASFPLIIPSLGYGYALNHRGFQGLLNHPQAYAVFLSPFVAWHTARLITLKIKGVWAWIVLAMALGSLFMTGSRMGMLSSFGGLACSVGWYIAMNTNIRKIMARWIPQFSMLFLVVVSVTFIFWPQISKVAIGFVKKGDTEQSMGQAFQESRGMLIERSMQNFAENKLTGIGFGLPSDLSLLKTGKTFLGIPMGAPIEKGIILSSVLEETGLIGFAFFILLLVQLIMPILKSKSGLSALALTSVAILVNLGESVFFSLGGIGMLMWLMFGVSHVICSHDKIAFLNPAKKPYMHAPVRAMSLMRNFRKTGMRSKR